MSRRRYSGEARIPGAEDPKNLDEYQPHIDCAGLVRIGLGDRVVCEDCNEFFRGLRGAGRKLGRRKTRDPYIHPDCARQALFLASPTFCGRCWQYYRWMDLVETAKREYDGEIRKVPKNVVEDIFGRS